MAIKPPSSMGYFDLKFIIVRILKVLEPNANARI